MTKIKIVPREGSRRVGQNVVKRFYESLAHADRDEATDEEKYDEERWAGTTQKETPIYDHSLRRFPLKDPTDPKLERDLVDYASQQTGFEKLNQIAKSLRWRNPKGVLIEQIDIFDPDDDILNHDDMFIKLSAGKGDFDDANPVHMLMFLHLRQDERYEVGPETNHPIMNRKVKYVIVDTSLDDRLQKEKRLKRKEVFLALDKLQKPSEKLKIALMLNLVEKHTVNSETTLDNLIENYANDEKTYVYGTMTRQDHFLKIMNEPKEVHDAYFLFSLSIEKGHIKFNNNHWVAFGEVLGSTKSTAIESLALDINKPLFDRLSTACNLALEIQLKDKDYSEAIKQSLQAQKNIIKEEYLDKIDTGKSTGPGKQG